MKPSTAGPRVARIELSLLEPVPVPGALPVHAARRPRAVAVEAWSAADPALERLGRLSGAALGVAWLLERERSGTARGPDPLLVSVGAAVVRGLPTAARATVAARAPQSGLYADGQVGSALGRRLAAVCDLLVLEGTAHGAVPGARVLWIEALAEGGATAELLALADLVGAAPLAVGRRLRALGAGAVLSIGPGGERLLPFASLASGDEPPSFVGRGGLGAVLGRLGLKAVALAGAPLTARVQPAPEDAHAARELVRLLERSPRLAARGAGGSLELFELSGGVERAVDDARAAALGRKGCQGCPTPCGWVLDAPAPAAPAGERAAHVRGAHHAALAMLGAPLGLTRLGDALELLAACDAAGIDARETGRLLELVARACETGALDAPSPRGDRRALAAWIDDLAHGGARAAALTRGVEAAARALGLPAPPTVRGAALSDDDGDLARLLGRCVSVRGAEPLRALAFVGGPGAGAGRLAHALAPLPACTGIDDARDPRGKGRVVCWQENLSAALDALGFCAFSAAGLIGDGLCDVDALARALVPAGWDALGTGTARQKLCAGGASIVLALRQLAHLWGQAPDADRPAFARARLERPGMWDEYRALRGLDEHGRPTAQASARLATVALCELVELDAPAPAAGPAAALAAVARRPGVVRVRGLGPLADDVGELALELPLPATVLELVRELAARLPRAAPRLVARALPVPAVLRDGHALGAADLVRDGERVDLVLAIAGGAA